MFNKSTIKSMMHSPVHNYIVPGLTSWLIGEPNDLGTMRVFTCSRDHQECIAPHSHRYDFNCIVLDGFVENYIWFPANFGDEFIVTKNFYRDAIGKYEIIGSEVKKYAFKTDIYSEGQSYSMSHAQIHSIKFAKNTMVLFFEGPKICNDSFMLEPFVNGHHIPTGIVLPWMFERDSAPLEKASDINILYGCCTESRD